MDNDDGGDDKDDYALNLWAFRDPLDHGKVDKDPRGKNTQEDWLMSVDGQIIVIIDHHYQRMIN